MDKTFSQARNAKFFEVTNNFVQPKNFSISYLVYNEENYNTLVNTLSATNICRITVFLFQNPQKGLAFFRIAFGNHFSFLPNFEYEDNLLNYFLSLLANFYGI